MDPLETTNVITEIVDVLERKTIIHDYIQHHVLFHVADGEATVWNLPFLRLPLLDIFRYDGVMLATALLLLLAIFGFLYKRGQNVPHGWSNFLEVFVLFVRNQIVAPYFHEKEARVMTPVCCTFFFMILTLNILGLCPMFSAATGNVNVTGGLALITLAFMIGYPIVRKGFWGFLKSFLPSDVPKVLSIMLAPIEVVSMLSRIFALTIRLFANMMSGHILIYALLSIVVLLGWFALPVVALVVAIYFFELFVSILQAYIFTLLSAIFISQMCYEEH